MQYIHKEPSAIVEIFQVEHLCGTFLFKIDTKSEDVFSKLETMLLLIQ